MDASVPDGTPDSGAPNPAPNPNPVPPANDEGTSGEDTDGPAVTPGNPPASPGDTDDATGDDATSADSDNETDPSTTDDEPNAPDVTPPEGVIVIPSRVEAEQFVRFNEQDAPIDANECGDGRVDMGLTDDNDGECYVGWTQGGEWLEYDVWLASANEYSLTLRLASDDAHALAVLIDGDEVANIDAPAAGWTDWRDVVVDDLDIDAGEHVVRIEFTTGQTNFNLHGV